jgi:probable HAF family extracellular repeat protein
MHALRSIGCRAALLVWSVVAVYAAETYIVTDLGTLGGKTSEAFSINNAGVAAGYAALASGQFHAVILSNNVLSDLGTLGGSNSVANDINQSGQIAGSANLTNSSAQEAFILTAAGMSDVGASLQGRTNSIAHGINSSGTVVGEYQTVQGHPRPFAFANGIPLDLGFDGVATCVADSGQIGGYEVSRGELGFVITGGQLQYLPNLGSNITEVTRINTNGIAVGRSMTIGGAFHAFAYQDGKVRDLGTLGGTESEAYGVNAASHVVGKAQDKTGAFRAYIYRNGIMLDLNDFLPPGLTNWVLTVAYGINDLGQIVGSGQFKGDTHGFILTPNFLDIALFPGLTLNGKVGRSYRIDYLDVLNSTNSWQTLTNFALPVTPYFFIDPRPVGFANRIYRAVLLP